MTFLILGRPRSRTAWVANFLSVPPVSLCIHEGLADAKLDYTSLRGRMDSMPVEHAGCADTGFIHAIDKVLETWPGAKLVIMICAEKSWERFRAGDAIRESVDRDYSLALNRLLDYAHPCDADAVTRDERVARALWEHCIPTMPFCAERWRILKDMNVQVQLDSLPRRFNS